MISAVTSSSGITSSGSTAGMRTPCVRAVEASRLKPWSHLVPLHVLTCASNLAANPRGIAPLQLSRFYHGKLVRGKHVRIGETRACALALKPNEGTPFAQYKSLATKTAWPGDIKKKYYTHQTRGTKYQGRAAVTCSRVQ